MLRKKIAPALQPTALSEEKVNEYKVPLLNEEDETPSESFNTLETGAALRKPQPA